MHAATCTRPRPCAYVRNCHWSHGRIRFTCTVRTCAWRARPEGRYGGVAAAAMVAFTRILAGGGLCRTHGPNLEEVPRLTRILTPTASAAFKHWSARSAVTGCQSWSEGGPSLLSSGRSSCSHSPPCQQSSPGRREHSGEYAQVEGITWGGSQPPF